MRSRPAPFTAALVSAFAVTLLAAAPALAQSLGLSTPADLYCGFERDLAIEIAAPATPVSSTAFVDGSDSYFSFGCTFCVSDKNTVDVGSMNVVDHLPAAWTIYPLLDSEDHDSLMVAASIQAQFPDYVCWLFRAADFTFANPVTAPLDLFTFDLDASADFRFVLDSENSGWFKTDLSSGDFTVCDSVNSVGTSPFVGVAGPSAAREEETSWSGVKALFR